MRERKTVSSVYKKKEEEEENEGIYVIFINAFGSLLLFASFSQLTSIRVIVDEQ